MQWEVSQFLYVQLEKYLQIKSSLSSNNLFPKSLAISSSVLSTSTVNSDSIRSEPFTFSGDGERFFSYN